MLTPWRITTRPLASVIQRPECPSGAVGAASAAEQSAEATPATKAASASALHALRTARSMPRGVVSESLHARRRGLRQRAHVLEVGAGEGPDHHGVQGAVARELPLGHAGVFGGDAHRPLGLPEPVEVPPVALVQVAVEG